ncbi:MAG: YdeI/OmpD-associated family protein [Candidatus Cloacimonetes bacterium]|nr:YdeI/OmpD-associated family protein [Candidatus Cloacimonadota bacterium]MCF7814000.1 YdeI/OmpD-associated family protein [Candidatus Cloacimonadota bacterium]MCF7868628.1 YdeI/OmpD-associated family protein [Candidatus Cloacimonadota bacterium]MCF7882857.1 YdeI/OmpD-associated family protein [Candidatus Cloacimonadota bacterium]
MQKSKHFEDLANWRKWLKDNHDRENILWLIFYKKHTGKKSISYEDSVQEALCWGWIDSIIKRIDDEKYARKFTPRTNFENWSDLNIKRMKKLLKENRVQEIGQKKFPGKLLKKKISNKTRKLKIPDYILEEISKHTRAKEYFENLASSHQRNFVGWIDSAKKEETKKRRLKEAIQLLNNSKKLGMK